LSTAVGSDHIVFGSKLPWQAVGPPHAELVYADIDANTRQAIARENLDRLLEMEGG
jgi:predicted TIM-barrel fold metal-dependent hydrolase